MYFVLFFCSTLFNFAFWPPVFYLMYKGKITPEMHRYVKSNKHWKFILIGVCNAFNGILIVFSSDVTRTPAPLQAILLQVTIPFTLFFSKIILRKQYRLLQMVGAFLVICGIIVSLVPLFRAMSEGDAKIELGSQAYWPFIFLMGVIPGVLMNIAEEWVFYDMVDFNINYLLALQSLYQLVAVALFFWLDIVPGFGTSQKIYINFGLNL